MADETAKAHITSCCKDLQVQPDESFLITDSDMALCCRKANAAKHHIIIVGGGVSGLSALQTLISKGLSDVVLFEARDKLGGRIRTVRVEETPIILEDGAQWIHTNTDNHLYKLAERLNAVGVDNLKKDKIGDLRIMHADGTTGSDDDYAISDKLDILMKTGMEKGDLSKYYGLGYGRYYTDRFYDEVSCGQSSLTLNAWQHFMQQYIATYEGSDGWEKISTRDANKFDVQKGVFAWKSGFDTVVDHFKSSVPESSIVLGTPIKKIIWEIENEPGAVLVTENGRSYFADHILVTVPLGYLQRYHTSLFYPPLPSGMQCALQGMTLGHVNKIFIGWTNYWWGSSNVGTRILWTKFDLPQEMEWLYGVVDIFTADYENPILMAFVAGCYSLKMEQLPEATVKDHFLFLMKIIYPNVEVPEPTVFRRSTWISDPWTFGSYSSFITLEGEQAGLTSRAQIRKPLINKWGQSVVHWAGEHTDDKRYGSVDGAVTTGIREANCIIKRSKQN